MKNIVCLVILFIINRHVDGTSSTYNDWDVFFKTTFSTYNKDVFPKLDQTQQLSVDLKFALNSIKDFDEVGGTLEVVGTLMIQWTNEILTWSSTGLVSGGTMDSTYLTLDNIWHPPIVLSNAVDSLVRIGDKTDRVLIYYNGTHIWRPAIILKASCSVNARFFPYDTQRCNITFITWDYLSSEVTLTSSDTVIDTTDYSANEIWNNDETSVLTYTDNGKAYVTFTIKLSRQPLYFLVNIVLPILLLGIMNTFVFLLPIGESRVSYAITAFLTFSVFLTVIGNNLPKTSDPLSLFAVYTVVMVAMSGLITVISIFTIRVWVKDADGEPPFPLKGCIATVCCKICPPPKEKNNIRLSDLSEQSLGGESLTDMPIPMTRIEGKLIEMRELPVHTRKANPGTQCVQYVERNPDSYAHPLHRFEVDGASFSLDEDEDQECCTVPKKIKWLFVADSLDKIYFMGTLGAHVVLALLFLYPIFSNDGTNSE